MEALQASALPLGDATDFRYKALHYGKKMDKGQAVYFVREGIL
jgi:hypothetical protein